jgi:hypothetical protein
MESKLPDRLQTMTRGTVVLVGTLPVEHLAVDLLVAKFGWSLEKTPNLHCLTKLNRDRNVVAALFNPLDLALPWEEALHSVLEAAPRALPILCHGFADGIDWPQVAEAGAFHSLLLPFRESEFRHTLGFISGAKRSSSPIQMLHRLQPRKSVINASQESLPRDGYLLLRDSAPTGCSMGHMAHIFRAGIPSTALRAQRSWLEAGLHSELREGESRDEG